MMSPTAQMQEFSFAYVHAIASAAGFPMQRTTVDDDSIDGGLYSKLTGRPRLEFQLKCTGGGTIQGSEFPHALSRKNYDDLRTGDVTVPRILIVVRVPKNVTKWLSQDEKRLLVRRCAYWLSLRGKADSPSVSTVTVHLPRTQIFGVDELQSIMTQIGLGNWP